VHMSLVGTFLPCQQRRAMSGFRGKAAVPQEILRRGHSRLTASGRWAASTQSFWTLYGVVGKPPNVHTNDHAPTLEEAKARFESGWKQWLAWF